MPEAEARFFRTPDDWRAWLGAHAAEGGEIWVGFFKRGAAETRERRLETLIGDSAEGRRLRHLGRPGRSV
jgi:hypothetical protein